MIDDDSTRGQYYRELSSSADGSLVANQWVHLVLVVSSVEATLYLDGVRPPPPPPVSDSSSVPCVVGVDDADDILPAFMPCDQMLAMSDCANTVDGNGGILADLTALLPNADPSTMISSICMASCGTCMEGTGTTAASAATSSVYGGGGRRGPEPWTTLACTPEARTGCNNAYSASGRPGVLGVPFGSFTMTNRDVILAGQAGSWGGGGHMFFGSMGGVAIFSGALSPNRIRCLNRYDAERLGTCSPLTDGWEASFLNGRQPTGARLRGDAVLDGKFGLTLDGEGDFATMPGIGLARRGRFTVSMWFLKTGECDAENVDRYEYLFSTSRTASISRVSGVHLLIACAGDQEISTASGDVLRAFVVDRDGAVATMDYSLASSRDGGTVTGYWVHVSLAVSSTAMSLYIDGEPADSAATGYARRFYGDWDGTDLAQGRLNSAVPDPAALNPPLSGFSFEENFEDFTQYNYTAVLKPGLHTFHAMDSGADGWQGGFWTVQTMDATQVLGGGRDAGQVTSGDTVTNFTVPEYQPSALAFGPGCDEGRNGYGDYNTYTQTVQLTAGVTYFMHTGVPWANEQGSWGSDTDPDNDPTSWTIKDQADETVVIAGGPSSGCCDVGANQQVTPVTVSADTTALIVISTTRISQITWVLNTAAGLLEPWEWGSTLDTGNTCGTPVLITISTQRYASELSWEIDDGRDDGRERRINSGLWHRASGPDRAEVYLGARVGANVRGRPESWTFFTGSIAGLKVLTYGLEADAARCLYREGQSTIQACAAPENMLGSHIYASFLEESTVPAGTEMVGDARVDEGFGAVVDGRGDAIRVPTTDYSSDGTFTIAFWFTKSECEVASRFERLFAHTLDSTANWFNSTNNTNIHFLIGCPEFSDSGMSTIYGDVVRVIMIDDDGNRGCFDFGLSSAKSGGIVEDAWVHVAMTVRSTSVVVYVDGRRLDAVSDRMRDATHVRAMRGPMTQMGTGLSDAESRYGDGSGLTLESSVRTCSEFCRSSGYSYFGLQWTNQCVCDNEYDAFGEASEDAADGRGTCDVDNDGTPDCGYGQDGYAAGHALYSEYCSDGVCTPRKACSWRNAVYEITESSADYIGCYLDGQQLTTCAEAPTCEMCALMGAPTALNPEGCGWSGRNGGGCFPGYSTSPWECAVSEYGFPADQRGDVSESEWWAWAQSEENVLWPDPTSLRVEACSASIADDGVQASCDAITLGTETSAAECNAVPNCVYQADSRLGGFTMDEVYTANSDVIIPLDGLSPGQHFMVASSSRGYGWQDGYWEVSDGSSVVAGGDSPPPGGQVTGPTAFGRFEIVEGTAYTLTIRAGANPEDISWVIDDGSVLSGPARGTLVLGEEREGRNGYEGNFAGLSILRRPIDSDEADCLYRDGAGQLPVCEGSDLIASERRTAFYGSFVDPEQPDLSPTRQRFEDAVTLRGNAYRDRDFGVQLDGDGDYIEIDASRGWYASGDTFTISLWFSKTSECSGASDDRYESLFSHQFTPTTRGGDPWEDGNSNVNIWLGCASNGIGSSVQSEEDKTDIVRIWLQDDDNNKGVFDVGLDSARSGGYVTDQWVHLVLSVGRTRLQVFMDGLPAQRYGFPTNWSDRGEDWVFSDDNMAWNSAYQRNAPVGHNPFACLQLQPEGLNSDGNCCAQLGAGSCQDGFVWSMGDICWQSADDPSQFAVSSYCVSDGSSPAPAPQVGVEGEQDQWGMQINSAARGLPKNNRMGRFAVSGLYESQSSYATTIRLTEGEHTFTPMDSRNENWNGGTWWIEDSDGGELVRGGTGESITTENTVFTVRSNSVVAAFGPGCRGQDRYRDYNANDRGQYRQLVTLQAGTYFMHSGGQLWDGASGSDPRASYWTIYNNETGATVAGGPGSGASRDDEGSEGVEQLDIPNTARFEVAITTFQTSNINWAITSSADLLGDSIRQCGGTPFTLRIETGTQRAWAMSWEIDGGSSPAGRNWDWDFSGPHRNPMHLGGVPRRDLDYEGSIAQVLLLNEAIDPREAGCLFRIGEGSVGICPTLDEMQWNRDWFGTFLGDSENRIASRDLTGLRQVMGDDWTTTRTEEEATAACASICSGQDGGTPYKFMGLQWSNECWCGNEFGSKGTAEEADPVDGRGVCDVDGDGTPDCGQGVPDATDPQGYVCGWRNAVYSIDPTGTNPDGTALDAAGTPETPVYVGCYADQITPKGAVLFGDAIEDQEQNFGVSLDGEGDYLTIDPLSQSGTRSWNRVTEPYCADGSFTVSYWFWKRACAASGAWEYLFSHQNNSAPIYNEPAADATWKTIPAVIESEEERQRWILSDPELHDADGSTIDQECRECMPNYWRDYRGNYTAQLPWLQPGLEDVTMTSRDGTTGTYPVGYPMYLCLDNAGHGEMDVHRTVESFLRWKCSEGVEDACSWKTWRRPANSNLGDSRMRTLFKLDNEIRSEADAPVDGYSSIEITDDLTPNANINMFLGCSDRGETSSLSGDILRTVLVDDESNRATFDWALDDARSGGFATDSWVHVVLTVDRNEVRTYVDGAEVGQAHIGFDNVSPDAVWTDVETVVPDLETYRAWKAFDSDLETNSSQPSGQCWECWPASMRGGGGGMTGGYDETEFVFPMYLALDITQQPTQHRNADVEATVRSWMAFRYNQTRFVSWRRGTSEGDKRSQALFIEGSRLRSEDESAVEGYSSIQVTTDVSWQMTSENEAFPNPARLNGQLSTFTLNGPVYMGVSATLDPDTHYLGHIAEVSLHRYAMEADEIDCMYRDVINGGDIAVCRSPWDISGRSYVNDLVSNGVGSTGRNGDRVELFGDTFMHQDLGLVFDGWQDYATARTGNYAGDGTYSVGFWFTRTDCGPAGNHTAHEFLFSHVGNQTARDLARGVTPGGEMPGNPELELMLACPGSDGVEVSSLGQVDIIRVVMRSDSDTTATFDVAMDSYEAAQGGLITDMWVALTLTVGVSDGATVIRFYYDGNEVGSDLSSSTFGYNTHASTRTGQPRIPDAENIILSDSTVQLNPTFGLLGGSSLAATATLGASSGGQWGYYAGGLASLAIYRAPLSSLDAACSFEYGESIHPVSSAGGGTDAWACEDDTDVLGVDCATMIESTSCVIGADDVDGLLPDNLSCETLLNLLGGADGVAGGCAAGNMTLAAPILGDAVDPSAAPASLCMTSCGTCIEGTETEVRTGPAAQVIDMLTVDTVRNITVYRLALQLDPALASNVYSLYAEAEQQMTLPPAFQVDAPFGADIGGTNPLFWAFNADAEFDSWVTLGTVDGSSTGSIGSTVDFSAWTADAGLSVSEGSVEWVNPALAPNGTAVIAQISVPTGSSFTARFNARGQSPDGAEDWSAPGLEFSV